MMCIGVFAGIMERQRSTDEIIKKEQYEGRARAALPRVLVEAREMPQVERKKERKKEETRLTCRT
jgi:hypothetical protein